MQYLGHPYTKNYLLFIWNSNLTETVFILSGKHPPEFVGAFCLLFLVACT